MPVIINEFEVLDESSQGLSSDTAATQEENEALVGTGLVSVRPIVPHTIIRILRHQKDRLARVRAH